MVLLVEIVDVDAIDAEAPQARLDCPHHPMAREPAVSGTAADRIAELGGEDPVVAPVLDRTPHDLLGAAVGIDVGRVDEVDALVAGSIDDAARRRLVRLRAEHHRAEAQRRDFQAATAETTIVHLLL